MLKENYVTVIGGANIDIVGTSWESIINSDSNPGKVNISLGGVGRNIAENLSRLKINTKLITTVGDDPYGLDLVSHCKRIGIDMDHSLILKNKGSSIYLSVHDEDGEMKVAISDMNIIDNLSIKYLQEKEKIIEGSKLVVIDTNIKKEVIEYLLKKHKNTDFFLDTVSTIKAEKIKDLIGYFHTIKPNLIEAEKLWGRNIKDNKDLQRASKYFLEQGVKRVFISLGKDGVYYSDKNNYNIIPPLNVNIINVTGAGDAFMAGIIYSHLNNFNIEYSAEFAMAASALTVSHNKTINPNITIDNITNLLKELK